MPATGFTMNPMVFVGGGVSVAFKAVNLGNNGWLINKKKNKK
jgi:hypothetical protein